MNKPAEIQVNKPKVFNKHHVLNPQSNSVYIGRGSKWGNPFIINQHGNRAEVIAKYRAYLNEHPELIAAAKEELVGKNLICFCAPLACHGDILLEISNPEIEVLNFKTEQENG